MYFLSYNVQLYKTYTLWEKLYISNTLAWDTSTIRSYQHFHVLGSKDKSFEV